MDYNVRQCLDRLQEDILFIANKCLEPLRQASVQLRGAVGEGSDLTPPELLCLDQIDRYREDIAFALDKMKVRIDQLDDSGGRPPHPGGELLANEPHAFKAQSQRA